MKKITNIEIHWYDGKVTCLGWQVNKLISLLREVIKDCYWYVGDIGVSGYTPGIDLEKRSRLLYQEASDKVAKYEDVDVLQDLISDINQFDLGVFVAVPKNINLNVDDLKLYTEEDMHMQIKDALIEIRTFDFNYFVIFVSDIKIVEQLKKEFPLSRQKKDNLLLFKEQSDMDKYDEQLRMVAEWQKKKVRKTKGKD